MNGGRTFEYHGWEVVVRRSGTEWRAVARLFAAGRRIARTEIVVGPAQEEVDQAIRDEVDIAIASRGEELRVECVREFKAAHAAYLVSRGHRGEYPGLGVPHPYLPENVRQCHACHKHLRQLSPTIQCARCKGFVCPHCGACPCYSKP